MSGSVVQQRIYDVAQAYYLNFNRFSYEKYTCNCLVEAGRLLPQINPRQLQKNSKAYFEKHEVCPGIRGQTHFLLFLP